MKVAGSIRVSTIGQLDNTSPEEQRDSIRAECQKMGYDLIDYYEDAASGKNVERQGLTRLLEDAKNGKFQILMTTVIDRFGRDLRDMLNIRHTLKSYGVGIYCTRQSMLNEPGLQSDLMFNILSAFAEYEWGTIRERTQRGRKISWTSGKSMIGSLPLGYKRDENKKVVVDPEAAKLYKRIVSLYVDQNFGTRDIAIKFQSEGLLLPTCRKNNVKRWHHVTIGEILKNPCYTGEAYQNQYTPGTRTAKAGHTYNFLDKTKLKPRSEWVVVKYPPLITKARWDAIQAKIDFNKRKPWKRHYGAEEHFLCDTVLFCGLCGSRVKKILNRPANFRYACHWYVAGAKERLAMEHKKCSLDLLPADEIDGQVFSKVMDIITNPTKYAKEWFKDADLEELKTRVESLNQIDRQKSLQLHNGYDQLLKITNNDSAMKMLEAKLRKIEAEQSTNKQHLHAAEEELSFKRNQVDRLQAFENQWQTSSKRGKIQTWVKAQHEFKSRLLALPFTERKRIVEAVINPQTGGKVLLKKFPDGEYDLIYNIQIDIGRIEALIGGLSKTRSSRVNGDSG